MKIEVALTSSATPKERGDLLEALAEKLLNAQSYEVIKEIRFTAVELDLLCRHKISGKEIYVECKAYRDKNIDANILKNLAGTLVLKDYSEAWLISTSEFGKEAKGFAKEWKDKPKDIAIKLSFYEPDKVIESLIHSGVIKHPPKEKAAEYLGSINLIGDWVLLVTPYGDFWAAASLSGGIPTGVICFYANNNERVTDTKLLNNLSLTDTTLSKLEFKSPKQNSSSPIPLEQKVIDVVEVQTGEGWSDYRPARPQDFVGRTRDIRQLLDFFKKIQNKETKTRIFALTGDSGMGKSSLVAKLTDKACSYQNKSKYFVYPVDVRAATSPDYIYSALLKTLKAAQNIGFGDPTIELIVSDVSNPLNSESIKLYIETVEHSGKVIVLIFDQFEELYSKPELFEVFNRAKSLLLGAAALRSNFCLGFAWKSDSTTHGEHPAYFFWHQLSDYRITIKLSPFSDSESNVAINIFEKEIGQKLHNDLRHNLIVSSQGYPWLLKKLCIHIYEKMKDGADQDALLANKLDVASLFDSDLQQLSHAERACLDFVAQRAPVDWFEVVELSGAETLKSLIERRLIVRSGDRLNLYWDIFREYVLTGKVPTIPLRYLPSTDFTSIYKVARNLEHGTLMSVSVLVALSKLSEGTVQNIGSDMYTFGIANREGGLYSLSDALFGNDEVAILKVMREKFKRHAFALTLKDVASNSAISLGDAINELKGLYPNTSYAEKTYHAYTVRMCRWLELCGLVVKTGNGWMYRDQGDVVTERLSSVRRRRGGSLFTAPSSPAQTLEVLSWLIANKGVEKRGGLPKGYRNAIVVLSRFELVSFDATHYLPNTEKISRFASLEEAIWIGANAEPVLVEVTKLLDSNESISGKDVGDYLSSKHSLNWTEASKLRNGSAIRQWAHWLHEGKMKAFIPKCPGRTKVDSGCLSLFE